MPWWLPPRCSGRGSARPNRPSAGNAIPGRPPAFAQRIQEALQRWARALCERDQAQARQEEGETLMRALGEAYYLFDLSAARRNRRSGWGNG
jgi:hypothetical protein